MRSRNVTRSRVEASAQCRSSMTSSTGAWADSSASSPSTAPNICCLVSPAQSASACWLPPLSGSSLASTGRAFTAASISGDEVRIASANGRYGTLSPISAHWPQSTVNPRCAAAVIASATSLDLPTPASPLTSAATARPSVAWSRRVRSRASSASRPTNVAIHLLSLLGRHCSESINLGSMEKVTRTDAEWRDQLSPEAYRVLRQAGTEAPFTGEYTDTKTVGVYKCRACGAELFRSDAKFESHCGWPSFYEPSSSDAVVLVEDRSHGMIRVEARCARCDSHLGHVFKGEGYPTPTDERWCINSISLTLEPEPSKS